MHPRVIVADSHPLFWLGVETAVGSDADIAVVGQATDAADLIEKWHRLKPNVALVDTMLPGLHEGSTLNRVLTAIPLRAIMLDTMANPGRAMRMIAAGARTIVDYCLLRQCNHHWPALPWEGRRPRRPVRRYAGAPSHPASQLPSPTVRRYAQPPSQRPVLPCRRSILLC